MPLYRHYTMTRAASAASVDRNGRRCSPGMLDREHGAIAQEMRRVPLPAQDSIFRGPMGPSRPFSGWNRRTVAENARKKRKQTGKGERRTPPSWTRGAGGRVFACCQFVPRPLRFFLGAGTRRREVASTGTHEDGGCVGEGRGPRQVESRGFGGGRVRTR
jgi:hypothetical protein